jgi:hypothetical protein
MGWNRNVDRIFKAREENKKSEEMPDIYADEYYDPKEDRIPYEVGDNLEKGDLFAMIVSAWIVIMPIALGILLLIVLLAWFLLGL